MTVKKFTYAAVILTALMALYIIETPRPPKHKVYAALSAISPVKYPVFGHSIIDGGIHSMDELRTAVLFHPAYSQFNVDAAKIIVLDRPLTGFVSYRADNEKIYWTRSPMVVPARELVFTDGRLFIRARCGNIISQMPMTPVQRETPSDIDTIVTAVLPNLDMLKASPMVPEWTTQPEVPPATVPTTNNTPPAPPVVIIPVFSITPINSRPPISTPEPDTWAMLIAGLALVAVLGWFARDVERQIGGKK